MRRNVYSASLLPLEETTAEIARTAQENRPGDCATELETQATFEPPTRNPADAQDGDTRARQVPALTLRLYIANQQFAR